MKRELGVYIHIPFCKQACSYCDFYFVTSKDRIDDFVKALTIQIRDWQAKNQSYYSIKTLYIGGGTPSQLSEKYWGQIIALFSEELSSIEEFTVEVNPDDVTREYLQVLKRLGVNRLSMGVQSFDSEILTFMHRAHSSDEAKKALDLINSSGLSSYSIDLIYANPGQRLEQLQKDVEIALSYDPPHISAYNLTIEPNTRLGKAYELGRLKLQDDDSMSDHFELVQKMLSENGYEHYEASNYAKLGERALHNSNYWNHIDYIGFGPSAHSFIWNNNNSAHRWKSPRSLNQFLTNPYEKEDSTELSLKELAEERLLLSLRMIDGVKMSELKLKYDYEFNSKQLDYIQKMVDLSYLRYDDSIAPTQNGLQIADRITLDLITKS